ncbi:hypothetical protein A0J61_06764 [Choanephora cucurbitarum]|uniref:Uncharacterized protein n=1 Tax=Choanephora cucurbitarum TaxID=101091 RepID=A0A1C7N7V6_9FUNG|nr:hypothetical protein A0J61_06764 [Choanephora cucurbitarum]
MSQPQITNDNIVKSNSRGESFSEKEEKDQNEGFKIPRGRKQSKKRNSVRCDLEAAEERMQKRFSKWKEVHSRSLAQNEMSTVAAILALNPFAPEMQNNPDRANAIKLLQSKVCNSLKEAMASCSQNEQ